MSSGLHCCQANGVKEHAMSSVKLPLSCFSLQCRSMYGRSVAITLAQGLLSKAVDDSRRYEVQCVDRPSVARARLVDVSRGQNGERWGGLGAQAPSYPATVTCCKVTVLYSDIWMRNEVSRSRVQFLVSLVLLEHQTFNSYYLLVYGLIF